eukprot:gene15870-biopygen11256
MCGACANSTRTGARESRRAVVVVAGAGGRFDVVRNSRTRKRIRVREFGFPHHIIAPAMNGVSEKSFYEKWEARLLPDSTHIICAPGACVRCGPDRGAKARIPRSLAPTRDKNAESVKTAKKTRIMYVIPRPKCTKKKHAFLLNPRAWTPFPPTGR